MTEDFHCYYLKNDGSCMLGSSYRGCCYSTSCKDYSRGPSLIAITVVLLLLYYGTLILKIICGLILLFIVCRFIKGVFK